MVESQKNVVQDLYKFAQRNESNNSWDLPINAGFYFVFRRNNTFAGNADVLGTYEVYSIKNMTIVQKVPDEQNGINYYTLINKDARRVDFRKQVIVGISMVNN